MDYLHFATTRDWLIATLLSNPAWFWFCPKLRQCKEFTCFVACFLSGTSYYGFLQKCSCPTRFWRLEAICHFATSGWYSSLWIPFRQMSLDFTDTRIHPIYGPLEDGHLCALFMLEGSWSAPCFCPKGTLGLSTRADSSPPLLEITA